MTSHQFLLAGRKYERVSRKICFNLEVKKPAFAFICGIIFDIYFIKAREDFFQSFHSLIYTLGGVGRILDSYANPRLRLGFA